MDYKKLNRWILDLLFEEDVHMITNVYVLSEDIVNAVKDIVEEHQNKIVEQLGHIHDNAIKVICSRPVQLTGYADGYADGVIKAIEIVKEGVE